jgi:hypothetical protein
VGILTLSRVDTVPTYMQLGIVTVFVHLATRWTPTVSAGLDMRTVQRMMLASFGFLVASYLFIRVFRA